MTDRDALLWKIVDGRLSPPPCARTLGLAFDRIDPERGTIEVTFEASAAFLNPAGNVQGGFLAATNCAGMRSSAASSSMVKRGQLRE